MARSHIQSVGAVLAVLLFAACSSSAATGANVDAPTTTTITPRTEAANGRVLHWTNSGPPLKLGTPFCDGGRCLYPFTETGTFHGDLEGRHVSAGASALDAAGKRFAVSRTDVFTGTVKGCGRGTLVFVGSEDATATAGTGMGHIAPGVGTGALAHATGSGRGSGTADATGIHSEFTGTVDCGK